MSRWWSYNVDVRDVFVPHLSVDLTINNKTMSDVFHATYRELTEGEKEFLSKLKDKASELHNLYEDVMNPNNVRETSLAKTKLEESIMWMVKGLTK